MENSKFISVIKTFSKKDLISFEKYLISPYFGCKQFAVNVFLEIKKYYPHFTQLDKQAIFKNAFPGKPYSDSLFRKSVSLLTGYAAGFISISFTKHEPEWGDYWYINYTRSHKLFDISRKGLDEFDSKQEDTEIHLDFFLYRYMMEREKVFYKLAAFSQKDACEAVVSRSEFLLLDFIIKFAMSMRELESNKRGFNYDYSSSPVYKFYTSFNFEKFLSGIKRDDKYSYIYEIALSLIKMGIKPNEEDYLNFKEAVMNHHREIHFNLSFVLFYILSAVSAQRSYKEHFEINKFMVEQEFFLKYGAYFQLKDFILVFKSALNANNLNWANEFLKKYLVYLNPLHQQNTFSYSNALICYHNKQFEKALEFLSKVKYQLFSFRQDINVMIMEIHYELGNYDTALSLIDAYKHFLRRNRFVVEMEKNRYNSFISFYTRLFNAKIKNDVIENFALKKELENESQITGIDWLLEKVNELLKQK